jgi:hypothetical protein
MEAIARAEQRGQYVSPHVRHLMRVWASRNVKMPNTGVNKGNNPTGITCIEAGNLPIPCDCAQCGESAVIFPPEDGSPWQGYCVCPFCTLSGSSNEAAKQ